MIEKFQKLTKLVKNCKEIEENVFKNGHKCPLDVFIYMFHGTTRWQGHMFKLIH